MKRKEGGPKNVLGLLKDQQMATHWVNLESMFLVDYEVNTFFDQKNDILLL